MLARAGVEVTVLEKHADFLRDFRGDTVHPVTMRLLDELGLFERFAALPQSRVDRGQFDVDGHLVTMVDFGRLHSQPHPYVAMVPQWDLLDLIADAGKAEPTFSVRMQHNVTGLLREGNKVTGVRYTSPDGPGELRADLVVGCDGRTSAVRRDTALPIRDYPVPFDVCWFRLPRDAQAQYSLIPRTKPGRALIMIPREGYFQIAYLIPKGGYAELRARGLDAFHRDLAEMVPESTPDAVTSWDDVKVLDVRLDRLRTLARRRRAVHRRCRARHVSGRRCRHQPCDRRRRCGGRVSGRTSSHRPPHRQASRRGTSTPNRADRGDPNGATHPAPLSARRRAPRSRRGEATCRGGEAAGTHSAVDGCPRLRRRCRSAAPARAGLRPSLGLCGQHVVGDLVGAQAQRADVGVVRLALHHVGPLVIMMADMAFQMLAGRVTVLVVHG